MGLREQFGKSGTGGNGKVPFCARNVVNVAGAVAILSPVDKPTG